MHNIIHELRYVMHNIISIDGSCIAFRGSEANGGVVCMTGGVGQTGRMHLPRGLVLVAAVISLASQSQLPQSVDFKT